MAKNRCIIHYLWFLFIFSSVPLSHSQTNFSIEEIVKKNIHMAGEEEKLTQIQNYSFKIGLTTYYISSDGRMKIVVGNESSITIGEKKIVLGEELIISECILIDKDSVKRNCFNNITIIEGIPKSSYQCLANLFSSFFTLKKFEDRLKFQGFKIFGNKKYYKLRAHFKDLICDFYLDELEITVKRVVVQGFDSNRGKYVSSYDFGPLQAVDGLKLPFFWFSSQIGSRGEMHEISEIRINIPLDDEFFSGWLIKREFVGMEYVKQPKIKN